MVKHLLLILALSLPITGCVTYTGAPPFFLGTFLGYFQAEDEAVPIGVRVETVLEHLTEGRYDFSGTARFGDVSYVVEGYEEASSNLGYLSPQALAPLGRLSAQLTNEANTDIFCISATVNYEDYPGAFLEGPFLYRGDCSAQELYALLRLDRQQ